MQLKHLIATINKFWFDLLYFNSITSGIRRQQGQALVFTLITLVVVISAMYLMVSSGQLAAEKVRLQNTSDAAAYSAGVMMARDYNFTAYSNRAMVANQVAIAQLAGLGALAKHNRNAFASLLNDGAAGLPGGLTSACAMAALAPPTWEEADLCLNQSNSANSKHKRAKNMDGVVKSFAQGSSTGINGLITTLTTSQYLYHTASILEAMEVVSNVVKKNDTDAQISTSAAQIGFVAQSSSSRYSFTKQYGVNYNKNELPRFADIVIGSLDGFSGLSAANFPYIQRYEPPFGYAPFWIYNASSAKGYPYYDGVKAEFASHAGGTELSKDFKSWTAFDGSEVYPWMMTNQWSCFIVCWPDPWLYDEFPAAPPLSFGHGAVVAGSASLTIAPDLLSRNYNHTSGFSVLTAYGFTSVNAPLALAFNLLAKATNSQGYKLTYSGLRSYQDLSNLKTDRTNKLKGVSGATNNVVPFIVIEVEKLAPKLITMAKFNKNPSAANSLKGAAYLPPITDRLASNTMRAVAGAEAYYANPQGGQEWPNLFNPYWQTRLRDTRSQVAVSTLAQ